jgi:hypothetical protein
MDPHEFYKYSKVCIAAQITIYPKPSNTGRYKIIVRTGNFEKEGQEFYHEKAYSKNILVKTPKGMVNAQEIVPSVWDKITMLYKEIALKKKLI